ncbi:MAG: carbohydrate ABC transporter permease [Firmicutes bacterium]|nr:carbohydrate ABC transporter permease [Bacillota bacterium]
MSSAITGRAERAIKTGRAGRAGRGVSPWGIAGGVLKYGILIFGAFTIILPFIDMFLGAVKTIPEMRAEPPVWISRDPQWGVFLEVMHLLPMARLYTNSFLVSISVTFLVLFTSALAGFVLAKYRFPGRDLIFGFILATMMFPVFLFLIPNYYILRHIPFVGGNDITGWGGTGLMHSRLSLILPFMVSAWGIFMLRQFAVGLPDELLDSARIDGASEFRIFWQMILPQLKPALATLAVFQFMGIWNEYLWAMTITTSAPEMMTVPVGIWLLRDSLDPMRNLALIRAATAVAVVPIMILFVSLQKYYVKGIVMTGIKG